MGLGKKASEREILSWPLTFMWGGVAGTLDAYGSPSEYRNLWKMPLGLMCWFKEQQRVLCREGKLRATTVSWVFLWAGD